MRLIDAKALLENLPVVEKDKQISLIGAVADMVVLISNAPTIDAVPVVHGRWIWDEVSYDYTCSSCKCSFDYSSMYGLFDHGFEYAGYCPNCGARMDGEADG